VNTLSRINFGINLNDVPKTTLWQEGHHASPS
jgi:hypothetical protein